MTTQTDALRSALLAILAAATLTGCGADPVASPTADAAPSGSASPSGTAPSTGFAAPGEVTIDPSLPDALPLPDDIWGRTEPGWVLATYSPQYERRSGEGEVWKTWSPEVVKKVIYLVSPEGQRYQVLEIEPDAGFSIESWTAGESSAIVMDNVESDGAYQAVYGVLDLTTGAVSSFETPSAEVRLTARLPSAVHIWTQDGPFGDDQTYIERGGEFLPLAQGWLVGDLPSPDGKWSIALTWADLGNGESGFRRGVVRLSTGEITPLPELDALGPCGANGWTDSGTLLTHCRTADDDPGTYFEVEPSTGSVTESDYVRPANDGISLARQYWLSPGVWAGNGGRFETEGGGVLEVGIEDNGVVTQLAFVDERGTQLEQPHLVTVVDGVLYVDTWSFVVVAYDAATERQVVLLPGPPNAAELGTNVHSWALVSWAVAR